MFSESRTVSYLIENIRWFVEYRILTFAEAAVTMEDHQVPTYALKYIKDKLLEKTEMIFY